MTEPDESQQRSESAEPQSGESAAETEHAETAASDQPYFADDVWQKLQAQDRAAAKTIVMLLTGLFIVGLILYGIIAVVVS